MDLLRKPNLGNPAKIFVYGLQKHYFFVISNPNLNTFQANPLKHCKLVKSVVFRYLKQNKNLWMDVSLINFMYSLQQDPRTTRASKVQDDEDVDVLQRPDFSLMQYKPR